MKYQKGILKIYIPFKITTPKIRYFGIKLTKEVKDLYTENYKTLIKKTEDDFGEGNGTPLQYSCLENHGWRSLVGCSPWGLEESDTTERLPFHFSLSRAGEGNGNPLQCSCLENPRDGGAWWAAVYGVAQSRTRLKRLSSSSSTW